MSAAIRACVFAGRGRIQVKRVNGRPRRYIDIVPYDREAAVAAFVTINGHTPARVIRRAGGDRRDSRSAAWRTDIK